MRLVFREDVAVDFNNKINRIGTSCLKWDSDPLYATEEVLPMWVADMDFPAPKAVSLALEQRAKHPVFGYTYDNGEFQHLSREWISRRYGWEVKDDWISFSPSVLTSLALFINIVSRPGQRIMIMPPVYYPFSKFILNNQRETAVCPLCLGDDGNYTIDFERFRKMSQDEDVVALILCNPHNPVGRVFTKNELYQIGDICLSGGIKVFSDEIHADLVMPGYKHIPFASLSESLSSITVTAYSPSKTFNLAGLQASCFVIPNESMREQFLNLREAWGISNINIFAYEGFKAAYGEGDAYVKELVNYLSENKRFVVDFIKTRLPELSVSPLEGTYLMWLDCSKLGLAADELDRFFGREVKISLDSGNWFGEGGENHMRINIACPKSMLEQAMNQLYLALHG